jgi:uncharacterized membrane protein YgcG
MEAILMSFISVAVVYFVMKLSRNYEKKQNQKDPQVSPKVAAAMKRGSAKARAELKSDCVSLVKFWIVFWPLLWMTVYFVGHVHASSEPKKDVAASTAIKPASLPRYFNDEANLFDSEMISENYNKMLADFDKETSAQLAVAIYPDLPSGPVEDFTIQTAEESKLGSAGRDNGAILFIFMKGHVARLEVGYGLEGLLTDLTSSHILKDKLVPGFAKGEYTEGIDESLGAIMAKVRQEYRNGRYPGRYRVLYRKVKAAVPVMLGSAWVIVSQNIWPHIRDADLRGRINITFFGTMFGTLLGWPVLNMFRGIAKLLWIKLNRRRFTKNDKELINSVGEDALSLSQLLFMVGFFGVITVGIVVIAAGGTYGGGGALIRW